MKKTIGILLIIVGIVGAGYIFVRSTIYAPDTDITPITQGQIASSTAIVAGTSTEQTTNQSDYPSRLIIPKIGVNAGVQYVGVKSNGAMANPSNFTDVGWYKNGTVPGFPGAAVMGGHVDNALALKGVFKHLEDLVPGDTVQVKNKSGEILTFKVDKLVYYDYLTAPSNKIFLANDDEAHLNLITCAGTWIQKAKSYDKRLVVYTTLVK